MKKRVIRLILDSLMGVDKVSRDLFLHLKAALNLIIVITIIIFNFNGKINIQSSIKQLIHKCD